jgi:flagellar motor switch protein FliN/FliY
MSEQTLPSGAGLFSEFSPDAGATAPTLNAARLSVADVPVRVSAVLGKKRLSVAELSALAPGAVIELDRRVGEPIDLYVNDRLVARGELVLVDGVLGVTMTEIVRNGA